jgi:hypothetical protein
MVRVSLVKRGESDARQAVRDLGCHDQCDGAGGLLQLLREALPELPRAAAGVRALHPSSVGLLPSSVGALLPDAGSLSAAGDRGPAGDRGRAAAELVTHLPDPDELYLHVGPVNRLT